MYLFLRAQHVSGITFIRHAQCQMITKPKNLKIFDSNKIKGLKQFSIINILLWYIIIRIVSIVHIYSMYLGIITVLNQLEVQSVL